MNHAHRTLTFPPSFAPTPAGACVWEQELLEAVLGWACSVFYQPARDHSASAGLLEPIDRLGALAPLAHRISLQAHADPILRLKASAPVVVNDDFTAAWIDRDWVRQHVLGPWVNTDQLCWSWEGQGWASLWWAIAEAAVSAGIIPEQNILDAREYQTKYRADDFLKIKNIPPVDWRVEVLRQEDLPSITARSAGVEEMAARLPPLTRLEAQQAGYETVEVRTSKWPVRQAGGGQEPMLFTTLSALGPQPRISSALAQRVIEWGNAAAVEYVTSHTSLPRAQWVKAAQAVADPGLLPWFFAQDIGAATPIPSDSLHLTLGLPLPTSEVPWLAWALYSRHAVVRPLFEALPPDQQHALLAELSGPLDPWRLFFQVKPDLVNPHSWELFGWLCQTLGPPGVDATDVVMEELINFKWRPVEARPLSLERLAKVLDAFGPDAKPLDEPKIFKAMAERAFEPGWLTVLLPYLPPLSDLNAANASAVLEGMHWHYTCALQGSRSHAWVKPWEENGWGWPEPAGHRWDTRFLEFARRRRLVLKERGLDQSLPAAQSIKPKQRF